jgi:hypothetical protein
LPGEAVQRALQALWQTREPLQSVPREKMEELVSINHAGQHWNEEFQSGTI